MSPRVLARSLLAVAVVLLSLSGCGSAGNEKVAGKTTPHPIKGTTFKAVDVAFTFHYPRGLKQVDEPNDGKVLASVTPTPDDVNNGLKIRKTAEKELPFASYASQIRSQFEGQLATKVSQSQEKRGTLGLGVLEWRKAYTKNDLGAQKTIRLHSTSYFFAGGGKTWQLECLSSEEHRTDIETACQQALGSIEFSRRG